ncbi:hypothetical protein [Nocardia vaccinii]|uniref:hypothetical protein n=1 Tax=Nocardia vaccinii TaxID=1822 RepID=UPI00082FD8D7|nr:hypothetical protein [Nocardia vaccinii]
MPAIIPCTETDGLPLIGRRTFGGLAIRTDQGGDCSERRTVDVQAGVFGQPGVPRGAPLRDLIGQAVLMAYHHRTDMDTALTTEMTDQ